jgi:hypothetical protein
VTPGEYRSRSSCRMVRAKPEGEVRGDNIDRIAAGVRIVGNKVIHRRATGDRPACGMGPARPDDQMVLTTAPVNCPNSGCV